MEPTETDISSKTIPPTTNTCVMGKILEETETIYLYSKPMRGFNSEGRQETCVHRRVSRQYQGSNNNSTVTGSGDRDFAAEFKRFMGFAFGNTTDMGFVKAINFMFIGFVLKQDAPGIQQGLGIRTDLFLGHLADQFTDQGTTDGLQSFDCLPWLLFSAADFSGLMPDEGVE